MNSQSNCNRRTIKRIIIIVASVIAVAALGLFLFFRLNMGPPGKLPALWELPKATNTSVGHTETVSFAKWAKEIDDDVPFVYIFNPDTGTGRLAVSQIPSLYWPSSVMLPGKNDFQKVSLLTVYTPEWKGLDGLLGALTGIFSAKMESCTFISYQEGQYLLNSFTPSTSDYKTLDNAEIIDPLADSLPEDVHPGLKIYTGIISHTPRDTQSGWTKLENGLYVHLAGTLTDTPSQGLSERISVFNNIVERFKLQETMGMS